jgi:Phosphatidylserine/phosphatidylglycerophosphate/cardiolipin synthases and related enzymes
MRYKNEDNILKLYAVAGTQTVLLSFDIPQSKLDNKNFLGFSVERLDKDGNVTFHNGTKHFLSLAQNPNPAIKNTSLVQSFYWQDYTVDPGQKYTYTIKPMFGTAINHVPKFESSIKVTTEEMHTGQHSVYFNYGVTGSQAYAHNKEFGNKKISELKGLPLQHALEFLGRDLWSEGLLKFVRQATGKKFSIYGAFYEFQHPDFLAELKAAKDRGVDVQLIVSGKDDQYLDKKYKDGTVRLNNESMIKKAKLLSCIKTLRTKPSQPHNKFMVLCENKKPKQVWTGSTNITLAGIFGQCNTGHWIEDDIIADKYLTYWKGLLGDPAMSKQAKVSESIQADTDLIKLPKGTYTFFSPRDLPAVAKTSPVHLQHYADLIDSAKELVCMIFPFNMDEVFNTVFKKDKEYLRLLLFESASDAGAVKSNDTDVKVTAGAIYDGDEKDWAKEITTKATTGAGILYVHNKFFIIDPLSDNPIVVTGSANFSANSIRNNDENSLLIKGDARVADIYLTEFDRLFVHFWPRYLRILNPQKPGKKPQGFDKPLDETFTWHNDYFDETKFQLKRKKLFIKMSGTVKG